MVASKGGITKEVAENMTRRQTRDMALALALAHGGEVDWESGAIRPPKAVQRSVADAVSSESMRFGT